MTKAVRYDEFGGIDVLRIDEVDRPVPAARQVLVQVRAAAINPGEAAIRTGAMADIFPSTFPSGQGSDLAGVVAEIGAGADRFSAGEHNTCRDLLQSPSKPLSCTNLRGKRITHPGPPEKVTLLRLRL